MPSAGVNRNNRILLFCEFKSIDRLISGGLHFSSSLLQIPCRRFA